MNATIGERVAAGAAFLDEHDPQWWRPDVDRAINLGALDLREGGRCVLGQRCPLEVLAARVAVPVDRLAAIDFGEAYHAYVQYLSGLMSGWLLLEWACERGFIAEDGEAQAWADLTAGWKRVITERRSAATQAAIAAIGSRCTSCSQKRVNCRCAS